MEKARADAITEFKASQSFFDSCADYYGTGFDDCLKQVASAFPELDLSKIIMEESVSTTPTSDTIAGESDDPKNDNVILAQPAANPLVPSSNPSVEILDVENPPTQDKEDGVSTDTPAAKSYPYSI